MSIKKFALVTTALIGLYDASASYASQISDDLEIKNESRRPTKSRRSAKSMRKAIMAQQAAKQIEDIDREKMKEIETRKTKEKALRIEAIEKRKAEEKATEDRDFHKLIEDYVQVERQPLRKARENEETYGKQLAYNNSWTKYFKDNISSTAKAFGSLFY